MLRKFSLFDELYGIVKNKLSRTDEFLILDNETLMNFYDLFHLTHEDMQIYPGLEGLMANHIIIEKKKNEVKLLSGLVVEFDEKNKLLDNLEYDDPIQRLKVMGFGTWIAKFYPFYGFILSPEDEEALNKYADQIASKVLSQLNENLRNYVLEEWRGVKYLYHGTSSPLFLFEPNLIPRTFIGLKNDQSILRPYAFFSVIPTRTFACRMKSESLLPSLYRYKVINPIRNILDLDETTPLCSDGICNSGSKKGKECTVDPDCPSTSSVKKYSQTIQIYGVRDQDGLAFKIYEEGILNGYKWTGHEFEVVLVHPEHFIEFDSVQFYIEKITGKPCSDRNSPLTTPFKDMDLIYAVFNQYNYAGFGRATALLTSHFQYKEKEDIYDYKNVDIIIYYPASPKNPSIFDGYKRIEINVNEDFLTGFLLGIGINRYTEFYHLQIFEKTDDVDKIARLVVPDIARREVLKWVRRKKALPENASEDYKNGLKFFSDLYEK